MTRKPSATATKKNIGSNPIPARKISRRISGFITFGATWNFFKMTPKVINANAPSPWTVSKKRKSFRPRKSE